MRLISAQKQLGFTLIELTIVCIIIITIASVSVANFRKGEKSRTVGLAADGIIGSIFSAQNSALTGRATNDANPACQAAQSYFITFTYSNTYTIQALNRCGGTNPVETFTLPSNVRIRLGNGLSFEGSAPVTAAVSLRVAFALPYGQTTASADNSAYVPFRDVSIIVESLDGAVSRQIDIDGVSGRITQ